MQHIYNELVKQNNTTKETRDSLHYIFLMKKFIR